MTAALLVQDLEAGYGGVPVLRGVTLAVERGQVAALLGPNGAGKSTLLRAVSGLITVSGGQISVDGRSTAGMRPERIAALGVQHVAEGHRVFKQQTVKSNLQLGLWVRKRDRTDEQARIAYALELFPALTPKLNAAAGTLSGGQLQMLSIAQALVADPQVLMVDEPSMGLAPVIIDRVFEALAQLCGSGMTILLVEQAVSRALELADYGYVLRGGVVRASGTPATLRRSGTLEAAYLGVSAG